MKLSEYLPESHLVIDPPCKDRDDLCRIIVEHLMEHSSLREEEISQDAVSAALIEREETQTSGIGGGVAFPHARILGLKGTYNLLIVTHEGMEFHALDKKPVYVFFCSLVPREEPAILLKTRSAFVRFLKSAGGVEHLREIGSAAELAELLKANDQEVEGEIYARDLMRPVITAVNINLSLRDGARLLHSHRSDALPVVDDEGRFLGEFSCDDLFHVGLPDFFYQLPTISFMKHMNPFERYFRVDREKTLADVIEFRDKQVVAEDATLMEVVFALAVKNIATLYVLDAGNKLLGIIDRYTIIDKILVANAAETL
ncbi:MAG: CBS domain-containing protein [Lentisphaerae bacterium]|nr:MAG: CBS domain-containing protein [Lentisphaerota bacterium]